MLAVSSVRAFLALHVKMIRPGGLPTLVATVHQGIRVTENRALILMRYVVLVIELNLMFV